MFRTLKRLALVFALAASPAAALDLEAMSQAEKDAFGAAVREYLLSNPEVLMEAISVLERREEVARSRAEIDMIQDNAAAIFEDGHSWVGGNPDGDVTLVEFMDYRCSYCRRAAPEIAELLQSDGNIRWIVKEFPILGEESVVASRFAISVLLNGGDEAYGEAHERLITLRGSYDDRTLRRIAEGLKLDADEILAGMKDPRVDEIIAENRALAQKLGINGTPSFVLETQMIRGYLPVAGMREYVRQARIESN